jgi:hypothetical protein
MWGSLELQRLIPHPHRSDLGLRLRFFFHDEGVDTVYMCCLRFELEYSMRCQSREGLLARAYYDD